MVVCPVRGAYNHIDVSLLKKEKSPLKVLFDQYIGLLNPCISFTFYRSPRNFRFCPELSDGEKYNHRYMSPQD